MSAPSGRSPFHRGTNTGGSSSNRNRNSNAYTRDSLGSSSLAAASPSVILGTTNNRLSLLSYDRHEQDSGRNSSYYSNSLLSMSNDMNTPNTSSPFWNPHLPLNPKGIDLSGVSSRVGLRNGKKQYGKKYSNDDDNDDQEDDFLQSKLNGINSNNADAANVNTDVETQTDSKQNSIKTIRNKVKNCLENGSTTPELTIFYSSILYTKTSLPSDAYLYAQSLLLNNEPKRAVSILQHANLITSNTTMNRYDVNIPNELYIEASLLASKALCSIGEYQEACTILENSFRYPLTFHNNNIIQNADDPRIPLLVKSLKNNDIHPISRLCYARGKLYDILSNSDKAISFLKLALKIDVENVVAFQYIVERNLMSKRETFDLIGKLEFEEEWIRDFYYANCLNVIIDNQQDDKREKDDRQHTSVHIPDQSSIYPAYTPSPRHLHSFAHGNLTHTNLLASPSSSPPPPPSISTPNKHISSPLTIFHRLYYTHNLQKNTQILALAAQSAYEHYHTKLAVQLCSYIHTIDPHCPTAAYIYAASLHSLAQKRLLYQLGHTLVQSNPTLPQPWFIIGCYYHLCAKYDIAQRHFCRASRLDPRNAYIWLAFGCSFASADESDQALASFRSAQRLHPSNHIPSLYIGMEYLRTNHLTLSHHFLSTSHELNPYDPLPLNELGVIAYRHGEYEEAVDYFLQALGLHILHYYNSSSNANDSPPLPYHLSNDITLTNNLSPEEIITLTNDEYWEPTIFNLGQSLRKLKNYHLSILSFQQSISLKTSASSYAALGFTHHCNNDINHAIDNYHKALGIQSDHAFSMEMLHRAMEEMMNFDIIDFEESIDTTFRINDCGNSTTNRLEKLTLDKKDDEYDPNKDDDYDSDDHKLHTSRNNESSGMDDSSNFSLDASMMS